MRGVLLYLALLQVASIQALLVPDNLVERATPSPSTPTGRPSASLFSYARPAPARSGPCRGGRPRLRCSSLRDKCGNGGAIRINDFTAAKGNLQSECDRGDYYPTRTAIIFLSGKRGGVFLQLRRLEPLLEAGSGRCDEQIVRNMAASGGGEHLHSNVLEVLRRRQQRARKYADFNAQMGGLAS